MSDLRGFDREEEIYIRQKGNNEQEGHEEESA